MVCTPSTYAASKISKVSGLKQLSSSKGAITMKWSKAKGAKKYKVYVSTTSSSKGFKCKKTVSGTKTTISSLKPGQKVWVKVKGINGKKKGSSSKVVKMTAGKGSSSPQQSSYPYTVKLEKGNSFTVSMPYGYTKYLENTTNLSFKSDSLPLKFISFSVADAGYMDTVKTNSGATKTYNGIEGYEYSGNNQKLFSFLNGEFTYTIDVEGKGAESILHGLLSGLKL